MGCSFFFWTRWPFNARSKGAQISNLKDVSQSDQENLEITQKRMKSYIKYFTNTAETLKTLETSASINIEKDLNLDTYYLESLDAE